MQEQMPDIKWLAKPRQSNYVAAASYLTLSFHKQVVDETIKHLKKQPVVSFKAKDIFRASQLPLLGISNFHIKQNKKKIRKGEAISPILLVRHSQLAKVIVADGYHRLCTVYSLDEDADIPCCIV